MRPRPNSRRYAAIKLRRPTHFWLPRKSSGQAHLTSTPRYLAIFASWLTAATAVLLMAPAARSQCLNPYTTELHSPVGIVESNTGNLLVSESGLTDEKGLPVPNTGIISIVNRDGRRTLLSGLPSGINDQGGVSGPAGLFMRGRTLYVAISAGDAAVAGTIPGSIVANPAPSSPIFSSVLALHFSSNVEDTTAGFAMAFTDQETLASGGKVTLSNGHRDEITIELVVNFPDFIFGVDPTVAHSNPFGLVAVDDRLYVTDGGENKIWQIDIPTGSFRTLTVFPAIGNPLFNPLNPGLGGPMEDAVPTGITYSEGRLLVTLFRGFPFAPGISAVEAVDPFSGDHATVISGLTSAIDIESVKHLGAIRYLVLQFSSVGPFLGGPGLVRQFTSLNSPGTIVADCITSPTAMALDEKAGTLFVTDLSGRLVPISVAP
jgi:hypothetical protein